MFSLIFIARTPGALNKLQLDLADLNPVDTPRQPYPDEIQVDFETAEVALTAALLGAVSERAWVGIGVSATPGQDGSTRQALAAARVAVEQARTGSPVRNISVVGGKKQRELAEEISGILRLLYRIVAERSETELKIIGYLTPGVRGQLKTIAQLLHISPQAVSKTLTRAKWHEEQASHPAVTRLLNLLQEVS